MNSVVGRRAFVRNMTVGLPVLAGTTSISSLAQGATISRASLLVTPTADPRIDLVLRQMAGLHNDMLRRGPTAEDARAAASHLRTLVQYHQESGRDAEVSMAFRELIAEKGVRAISTLQPDFTHMRSALKSYGIDARAFDFGVATYDARVAALEMLAKGGVSPSYAQDASALDPVTDDGRSLCDLVREPTVLMEAMASTFCIAALFIPPLEAECLAATVILAVLKILLLFGGCQ
jgi:hypothetical protein